MATSTQVETLSSGADRARLGVAALLVVGSVVAFYLLGKQGLLAQVGALLVLLAAAVGVFLTAEPGKALVAFFRESWRELHKVVWPTRQETVQMTGYVFVFVVLMALFLWIFDKLIEWGLYDLILGWKR